MAQAAAGPMPPWSGTGPVKGFDLTDKTQRVFKWTAQELHPNVIKYSTTLYFLNKVLPRYLFYDMKTSLESEGTVGWRPQNARWQKNLKYLFSPESMPLTAVDHANAAGYLAAVQRPTFGEGADTRNPYFSKNFAFKAALQTVVDAQKRIESSDLDYAFDSDLDTAITEINDACEVDIANSLGPNRFTFLDELAQLSTFVR